MDKTLDAYKAKRDFTRTPEPAGGTAKSGGNASGNSFVIQKHAARRLHYDFRLEFNGVLKSWAVPEGPSLIPGKKRLAVHVEDHPIEYGGFEGVIPQGSYGAGTVMIWDKGTWTPEFDPELGYRKGHLRFRLAGEKLKGSWHLVRMARKPREKQEAWLLFKSDDEAARPADAPDILAEQPRSAATGREMDAIAREQDRTWLPKQGEVTKPVPKPAPKLSRGGKPPVDPAGVPGAKAGKLPAFVEPCLPTTVERAASGDDWVHEIKHDGYRTQARIADGRVTLLTRTGLDWTERFPGVARAMATLPVKAALIDGEIVAQTEAGIASFTALVDVLKSGRGTLVYYAFDLLHLDGFDLRGATLLARKAALAKILAAREDDGILLFSEHLAGDGDTIFRHAGRLGLEGIVSKKGSSIYRSGRVTTWLKLKSAAQGPFVVAGFIPSSVQKNAIGALVLAEHVDGKLTASGHVGSGFSAADAGELWRRLDPIRRKTAPIVDENAESKGVKWIEPTLVAEIEYRTRTGSGVIRHATFRELIDKDPAEVVRDDAPAATPAAMPAAKAGKTTAKDKGKGKGKAKAKGTAEPAPRVRLTNPGRLLWPDQGITKQGLADFYTEIAPWILPHITGRALSVVRCPGGVTEQCFFQKHRWAGLSDAVRLVAVPNEHEPMIAIDDLGGLLELVQASVLEIHPWGSRAETPALPDRATIDLDPADGVPWERVAEAALDVRERLAAHGLTSFVKTTGGKGLHVVFPIVPGPVSSGPASSGPASSGLASSGLASSGLASSGLASSGLASSGLASSGLDWPTLKRFTQTLSERMAADRPDRYTANMAKTARRGRIYVDYLRNGMGATAVAAYSTRARPGAAVSTPLAWDEIGAVRSGHFTVANLPKRLQFLDRDPWEGFMTLKQALPGS